MTTDRIQQLIDQYQAPDACPADLLCDRHPASAVAFTIVEVDLTTRDLTSESCASSQCASRPPLPAWVCNRVTASPS